MKNNNVEKNRALKESRLVRYHAILDTLGLSEEEIGVYLFADKYLPLNKDVAPYSIPIGIKSSSEQKISMVDSVILEWLMVLISDGHQINKITNSCQTITNKNTDLDGGLVARKEAYKNNRLTLGLTQDAMDTLMSLGNSNSGSKGVSSRKEFNPSHASSRPVGIKEIIAQEVFLFCKREGYLIGLTDYNAGLSIDLVLTKKEARKKFLSNKNEAKKVMDEAAIVAEQILSSAKVKAQAIEARSKLISEALLGT
jgi:hypothetical protein